MSETERLLFDFESKLRNEITAYFESIETFDNKFILNSSITAGSAFENNMLCSKFRFFDLNDLPVSEIILGGLTEVMILGGVNVATSTRRPNRGSELNLWSLTDFGISIRAKVSFNSELRKIEITEITIRN